jgi:hypothetical protein
MLIRSVYHSPYCSATSQAYAENNCCLLLTRTVERLCDRMSFNVVLVLMWFHGTHVNNMKHMKGAISIETPGASASAHVFE